MSEILVKVKRQLWQFQTTYIAFQIIFVNNCYNCRQYQENKTLVKSFSSIKKRWNILFNQKFFLILPLKAVSPWVGLCFQDILVWCTYGNASWRHHRHDIKKGRLRNVLSSTLESLVNFQNYKKIAQTERPRGWFYITIATLYIVVYNKALYSYILSHDVG